jgi:hypothetical protein
VLATDEDEDVVLDAESAGSNGSPAASRRAQSLPHSDIEHPAIASFKSRVRDNEDVASQSSHLPSPDTSASDADITQSESESSSGSQDEEQEVSDDNHTEISCRVKRHEGSLATQAATHKAIDYGTESLHPENTVWTEDFPRPTSSAEAISRLKDVEEKLELANTNIKDLDERLRAAKERLKKAHGQTLDVIVDIAKHDETRNDDETREAQEEDLLADDQDLAEDVQEGSMDAHDDIDLVDGDKMLWVDDAEGEKCLATSTRVRC